MPQIAMIGGVLAADCNCVPQILDGKGVVASFPGYDAQQVKGGMIARVGRDRGLQNTFRCVELSLKKQVSGASDFGARQRGCDLSRGAGDCPCRNPAHASTVFPSEDLRILRGTRPWEDQRSSGKLACRTDRSPGASACPGWSGNGKGGGMFTPPPRSIVGRVPDGYCFIFR
ncbi:MAG TPA: hypothetical protein VHC04_10160 [Rhodopila sp.]|nr:hypothetical protein [Rhodopila sp.]